MWPDRAASMNTGTLRFNPDKAPPASPVEKIVTVRLKENEAYGRP